MNTSSNHPYIGVDAIIVNDEGKVLLEKRALHMNNYPGCWGLPGGWVEWGETGEQAIIREVKEELGVEIEVVRFVGRYYDTPGIIPNKTRFALPHICKIVSGDPTAFQKEEVEEIRWVNPKEISNLKMAYDHLKMLQDEGIVT